MKMEDLMYFNGFGGFSKDGKEYCIRVTQNERTPLPWSHLLVNAKIGTLVTSNGGGFSWYGNSRENKLSSWSNDVILDTASEKIWLEDEEKQWSALSDSILEKEAFEVIYGFGYATYRLQSERYEQETTLFVTENPAQKVSLFRIKNKQEKAQKIKIKFRIDAVLGVAKEYTGKHLVSAMEKDTLKIYNRYSNDYADYELFLKILPFGEEKIQKSENLEPNDIGIETEILLQAEEERELVMVMQYLKKGEEFKNYSLQEYKEFLEAEKKEWKQRLEKVQITTPVDSMNIILNGWILYQDLTSRIWGRASFYQSGGAYGFRDQLQDMLAILYVEPEMVKKQILYHAEHQFLEGDVLHWWHPERSNGIRTRFSDDLLWLVFLTCEYVEFTDDFEILLQECHFITGRALKEEEDEVYIETQKSNEKSILIDHCIRAIERSLDFGEHGLPKMGSGDWNDGMNTVGGESVWLGFFLADILKKFLMMIKNEKFEKVFMQEIAQETKIETEQEIAQETKIETEQEIAQETKIETEQQIIQKEVQESTIKSKDENRIKNGQENSKENVSVNTHVSMKGNQYLQLEKKLQEIKERYEKKYFELQKNLDKAWDGRWFKRAYFKDGEALGSNQNDECKIDNISQSWSVISGVAKKEKQILAMESVENYLADHENMLIKLLTPAFCNTKMEPGYIKSYIPGVRENGGQYTHGAIWSILANCILNRNEIATEYFRMLNPIEHTRTREDTMKYKAEPYVIVADIYSHPHLLGRGGWSWYTGSASWYFLAGVKYILGLQRKGDFLEIQPHFPKEWKDCHIKYQIEETEYVIHMIRIEDKTEENKKKMIYFDNTLLEEEKIPIILDGKTHVVEIRI